jgi:hypothetical protein
MIGWIRIHRQIQEHWIWKDPVKLRWWLDILLNVNFVDSKVNIGFNLYECKRGQSIRSLQTWADRWGVSKDTARNFLMLLEKDGMILHENIGKSTRITVCNYDSYQDDLHDRQTKGKRRANAEQTQGHANKEREEIKEGQEGKEVSEQTKFQIFNHWLKTNYPNVSRLSQQMTEENLNTLIEKYGREKLSTALDQMENYKKLNDRYLSVYRTAITFIKNIK